MIYCHGRCISACGGLRPEKCCAYIPSDVHHEEFACPKSASNLLVLRTLSRGAFRHPTVAIGRVRTSNA